MKPRFIHTAILVMLLATGRMTAQEADELRRCGRPADERRHASGSLVVSSHFTTQYF